MDRSPAGRRIDYVTGNPAAITSRGEAISTLGQQMLDSATVLEKIATRSTDQQGQAIDKLIETIDDAYRQLKEAGELYKPVGPVLVAYGETLSEVQPRIRSHVDNCETLWTSCASLPGEVEPRGTGGLFQPDEGSPEAQQQAEEDAAKKAAFEAWEDEAGRFDADYDTWEQAFDDAVSGITDEMSGKIQDGWTQTLAAIKTALSWAGLVLAVAGLIIGGPFIAALAAIVAAATLIVTAIQFYRGEASWVDLSLAVIDVLPVGKIAGIIGEGGTLGGMAGKFGSEFVGQYKGITEAASLPTMWRAGEGFEGVMTRLFTGKDLAFFNEMGGWSGRQLAAGIVDLHHGMGSAFFRIDGMVAQINPDYDGFKKEQARVDVGDDYLPVLDVIW
ncbi:hypothetical protein [Microbacterium suaedae]|uniref:hypothetical protein n=1 Tax=Microbacterium suaedae TaxID=2067813 RepID=UPI000DA24DFB|nr:hypothetical protein [Microbacterium suaedae]